MIKSLLLIASMVLSFSLPAAETPAPEPKLDAAKATAKSVKPIKVPPFKMIKNIKDAYTSIPQSHLLLILHLPAAGGSGFVEVHNRSKQDLAIFQFTLYALGHEGELEFEELPSGWSAVKEVKLSSLRELQVRTPRAYNKDASEISPLLVIHRTDLIAGQKLEVGKQKAN